MKLEKALEKAKKSRVASIPASSAPHAGQDLSASRVSKAPPVYRDSETRELDPVLVNQNRCIALTSDAPEVDFYKVLRTQILQRTATKGWNTLMVTSTRPGEGKTLTSINLALTIAKDFSRTVLLVDCDLRQQKIHEYLGLQNDRGIVDYLTNGTPLKDLIIWPKVEKLTLISGGRTINDSAELLGSPRTRELVAELKGRYEDRFVLFDVPPLLSGADALTFSQLVDAIVMVVEEGRTPIKEIERALELIPKEKFLGFVLNQAHISNKAYYYYGYHKGDKKRK